jgi:uncharacterized protein (DUF1810 family)
VARVSERVAALDGGACFGHRGAMADPHDLARFVAAQDRDDAYAAAERELRAGRKTSHWMWFVFPQLRGLGHSVMAQRYGIASREEAVAYLVHDVLGLRLRRCAQLVTASGAVTAQALMGSVDALKLRSSMTLFARAADGREPLFARVLERFYDGAEDPATVALLQG